MDVKQGDTSDTSIIDMKYRGKIWVYWTIARKNKFFFKIIKNNTQNGINLKIFRNFEIKNSAEYMKSLKHCIMWILLDCFGRENNPEIRKESTSLEINRRNLPRVVISYLDLLALFCLFPAFWNYNLHNAGQLWNIEIELKIKQSCRWNKNKEEDHYTTIQLGNYIKTYKFYIFQVWINMKKPNRKYAGYCHAFEKKLGVIKWSELIANWN